MGEGQAEQRTLLSTHTLLLTLLLLLSPLLPLLALLLLLLYTRTPVRSLDECSPVAGQPGGVYAVERINALSHAVKDVTHAPDAQQVHRPVVAEPSSGVRDYIMHCLTGRTEAAADGRAEKRLGVDV